MDCDHEYDDSDDRLLLPISSSLMDVPSSLLLIGWVLWWTMMMLLVVAQGGRHCCDCLVLLMVVYSLSYCSCRCRHLCVVVLDVADPVFVVGGCILDSFCEHHLVRQDVDTAHADDGGSGSLKRTSASRCARHYKHTLYRIFMITGFTPSRLAWKQPDEQMNTTSHQKAT